MSKIVRRGPSSGRTFWLKTLDIFINSPLRFLFLLMLIKTKEHTRQWSETFSFGLFTLIVKKPWTFSKQLVEGDLILTRTESYTSVSASCLTYLRGPCDEIASRPVVLYVCQWAGFQFLSESLQDVCGSLGREVCKIINIFILTTAK